VGVFCSQKIKIIRAQCLKCGDAKSCGCLVSETSKVNIKKLNESGLSSHSKYSLEEVSAREVWRHRYIDGGLSFDEFYQLSQQNCYYCGSAPENKNNIYKSSISFVYNGLDRTNNKLSHTFSNVVPCCAWCNISKRERTIEEFKNWIIKLYNTFLNSDTIKNSNVEYSVDFNIIGKRKYSPKEASARVVWKDSYKDNGNLLFEEFYNLSQQNCFYCDTSPNNRRNIFVYDHRSSKYSIESGDFIYNGLDRVDNTLPHKVSNVVPCCKYCNYSKGNRNIEEFKKWIIKLYNNI